MQGVEILTSAQVATETAWNPAAFWVTALIIFVIFIIAGVSMAFEADDFAPLIISIVIGLIMSTLFGWLMGMVLSTPSAHETQYKVTISDEVSMTEFYEHYEVIEQDGKIFTVREKTNEEH